MTIQVKRLIWNIPTVRLPKGYDPAPGYQYFTGIMILYPGSKLGLCVKSFYNKVYVTFTEQQSMASTTCYAGDSIIDVDGVPITTTVECRERIVKALQDNKFVLLTLERAFEQRAVRVVKCALLCEKSSSINPRISADVAKAGEEEARRIREKLIPAPGPSIYRGKQPRTESSKHVAILDVAEFTPIDTDPYNPQFIQSVPPKRMDLMHAIMNVSKTDHANGV
ncbi:hypothetical protein AB6A40_001646 [Gnathostoma spinigerum]|uniref:PDZ domain-containing protein n=1 Tax=Gnathostoma spinigerum TaxID=75299 RepID=A0ABD6E6R7_9BILA